MGSIERRVRHLEGLHSRPEEHRSFANPEARARMRAVFAEIVSARKEGREPAPWAAAVGEAIERRRAAHGDS